MFSFWAFNLFHQCFMVFLEIFCLFIKFTPMCYIVLYIFIISCIVALISISDNWLLVYSNSTGFHVAFVSYNLNSFISCNSSLIKSWIYIYIYIYCIYVYTYVCACVYTYIWSYHLQRQFECPSYFSYLIALIRSIEYRW